MARSKKKGKMILKSVIDNVNINKEASVGGNKLVPLNKPIIININFDFENQNSPIFIESIEVEYGLDLKNINDMDSNNNNKRVKYTKKNNNN